MIVKRSKLFAIRNIDFDLGDINLNNYTPSIEGGGEEDY